MEMKLDILMLKQGNTRHEEELKEIKERLDSLEANVSERIERALSAAVHQVEARKNQ